MYINLPSIVLFPKIPGWIEQRSSIIHAERVFVCAPVSD